MKRCEFLIHAEDHRAATDLARGNGSTFSEFVRQAVLEKIDREQVVSQVVNVRDELASLVNEIRQEMGRTRQDLMDDHQRGMDLIRQDIGKSMKKNEELNKTFVLMLGGQVAPSAPGNGHKKRGPARDEDAPMTIPG